MPDWKEGDHVFAIGADSKVLEADIKSVSDDPDMPYELDIKAANRFYAASDLYDNKDDALRASIRAEWRPGNQYNRTVAAKYDEDAHTYVDLNGNVVSEYFELEPPVEAELERKIEDMVKFCSIHQIPVVILGIGARRPHGVRYFNAAAIPGPRSSALLSFVNTIIQMEIQAKK